MTEQHDGKKNSQELENEMKENISGALFHSCYEASHFIITRYPYLCAVLLMVSTAELVHCNALTGSSFPYIYFSVAMYFVIGTAISYDLFRTKQFFSVVMVVMTVGVSFYEYLLFQNNEQLIFRMITRNIAVIGSYFSVAGGITKNEKGRFYNKILLIFGRQLLGVYAMLTAMHLWNSPAEFEKHSGLLPGGEAATYVLFVGFILSCICLYGDTNVLFFTKVLAVLILINMVFVDFNTNTWIKTHKHLKKWMIVSIACKNIPVLSTLLLYRKGYW